MQKVSDDQGKTRFSGTKLPAPLEQILNQTEWRKIGTNMTRDAAIVPDLLLKLVADDRDEQLAAARDLNEHLCHQHVMVSAAAVPAAPILFHALAVNPEEQVQEDILYVIVGLGRACGADSRHSSEPEFLNALRRILSDHQPQLAELAKHKNKEIAEQAESVLEDLANSTG